MKRVPRAENENGGKEQQRADKRRGLQAESERRTPAAPRHKTTPKSRPDPVDAEHGHDNVAKQLRDGEKMRGVHGINNSEEPNAKNSVATKSMRD